ncbi:MAG: hypothetical protein ACI8XC_004482, partial [Gammaproteobacteria bacterium]
MIIKNAIPLRRLNIIFVIFYLSCSAVSAAETNKIQWEALIPPDWNPNRVFEEMTDEQYNALSDEALSVLEEKAQAMFDAAPVIDELNGKRVKIPGFVLPLEFSNTLLKEF